MKEVRGLIQTASEALEAAGIESPRWDAERIVAHLLGRDRLFLYTHPEYRVDPLERLSIEAAVRRRGLREPLQHLTGYQEFWGHRFKVGPQALIPRPESELVIESALHEMAGLAPGASPLAVDIGTGTGCLSVTLALEIPGARIWATDASVAALALARDNAGAHGVSGRIRFAHGDLYEPVFEAGLGGRVDLLISNPPYISRGDFEGLQPEVKDYEPRAALDGGEDGLDYYRRLIKLAPRVLAPGGRMILELGFEQADPVRNLALEAGLRIRRTENDAAGIPRVLVLRSQFPVPH